MVQRIWLLILSAVAVSGALAQPTMNVLTRVLMVEVPRSGARGTVFSLDVDDREYWITAKHILNGRKSPPYGLIQNKSERLRILNPGLPGQQWLTVDFAVLDPGRDIDIAILVPPHLLLNGPVGSLGATSAGVMIGGSCYFLGFPYGGGWQTTLENGTTWWAPYIKHCFISAQFRPEGSTIWVLDGLNNPGFSGGPVIFGTGLQQSVFAVVSGFITEPADVITSPALKLPPAPSPPPAKRGAQAAEQLPARQSVSVNSGFILAYGINHAVDAIRKSPTGPKR